MTTAFSTDAAAGIDGPDWLNDRRRAAAERFASASLPSTEEEVWRYSRINDLSLESFRPATADDRAVDDQIDEILGSADGATTIRTENGRVVAVTHGAGSVKVSHDDLEPGGPLGSVLDGDDALTSLHDAFAAPIVIEVPAGADGGLIVVAHTYAGDGIAAFPRLVVDVGQAGSATVVEVHRSPDAALTLSVPVTELRVGRDATLRHAALQVLGDASWQIGRLASTVDQGGTLHAGTAAFGGAYARLRADTTLAGRGAHGELTAAYFGDGTQLLDFRTFQDHVAPDTTSNLLFKGALGQKGASVYTGLIKIRPGARGSQAFQTNRNVKLSEDAWAESVPNLEIENNEVQCSHASTVGPVDPEQRFYLESRGVPAGRAERLIVAGFFDEVVDDLQLGPFGPLVTEALATSLERSMP